MIDYTDDFTILCKLRGSLAPHAALHALPSTILALILVLYEDSVQASDVKGFFGLQGFDTGIAWNVMTSIVGILITFRIKQALGRFWEGTSLLHQMRGEWFDAASCLTTFSREAKFHKGLTTEVTEFRNTLIRLMSLMHGSALDEISGSELDSYEVIDIHGLDTETLAFLRECQSRCNFSKVEALQHLIQVLVTANYNSGVLRIPAPILSRVYQTLSRGFVNLLNARKIKDTMFPLPLVQTIKILLVIHSCFTPVIMTDITKNWWALLFSFMPLFGLHALNLIARQLEMPFGSDDNDLPLNQFQEEMNDTLIMLLDEGSDRMPTSSPFGMATINKVSMQSSRCTSRSFQDPAFFRRRLAMRGTSKMKSSTSSIRQSMVKKSSAKTSKPSFETSSFGDRESSRSSSFRIKDSSKGADPRYSDTKTFLSDEFFARRSVSDHDSRHTLDIPLELAQMSRVDSSFEGEHPPSVAQTGSDRSIMLHAASGTRNSGVNISLQQLNSLVVADVQMGYGSALQRADQQNAALSQCLETLKSSGYTSIDNDIKTVRSGTVNGFFASAATTPKGVSTPRGHSPRHFTPRQNTPHEMMTPREDLYYSSRSGESKGLGNVGSDSPAKWT